MTTSIEKHLYGQRADGTSIYRYTLKNSHGVTIQILNLGGIVTSILVPDKQGKFDDVTTGFDTLPEYEINPAYFGALVGRVANRIYLGKFELDGKEYQLALNRYPNHLHGGNVGFDKKIWECQEDGGRLKLTYVCVDGEESYPGSLTVNKIRECQEDGGRLKLTYVSVDGEESYPGTLTVNVTYELNDNNELYIEYSATTDKTTIVNLTNHAYFNLAGHKSENVYDHTITMNADHYLPKTEDGVPTGEIASVDGTPFDLRKPINLGEGIKKVAGPPVGYDHNFCVNASEGEKNLAARVEHSKSGRVLEVFTNKPGIQLYTGNYLEGLMGKDGAVYNQHSSFALETQNYPDATNHKNFPSCVLKPGQTYSHKTWYRFSVMP